MLKKRKSAKAQKPGKNPPRAPRKPGRLATLCMGLATLGCFLVGLEYVWRALEPESLRERLMGNPHFFTMPDPELGWKQRPGVEGEFITPYSSTHVRINRQGMRYHEVGPKQGFRVAVLGDALVWGYGVEEQERFTDRIEKALGVEMLNYGVIGYGPLQYDLITEQVLASQPDLVVIGFTLHDDFDDNVHNMVKQFYRPYATFKGGLAVMGRPVPDYSRYFNVSYPAYTQLALGRLLYFGLRDYSRPVLGWLEDKKPAPPPIEGRGRFSTNSIYTAVTSPETLKVLQLNEMILRDIQRKLRKHGVPMMLLALRSGQDKNANPLNVIRMQANRLRVPVVVVDKEVALPAHSFPDMMHYRASGHQLVAQTLASYIKPRLPAARAPIATATPTAMP